MKVKESSNFMKYIEKMNTIACQFYSVYQKIPKNDPNVFYPRIVNLSFACEMFIKTLLLRNGTKYPYGKKGHEIMTLFELLNDEQKFTIKENINHSSRIAEDITSIKRGIDNGLLKDMNDLCNDNYFDKMISKNNEAFYRWRYGEDNQFFSFTFADLFVSNIVSFLKLYNVFPVKFDIEKL